jgi:hypothetical protein
MNCSQHPPEISSQLTGIYFSRTSSNLGTPIRYNGKYGSLLWSRLLVLPPISIQDTLPQGASISSSQPGNAPINQKEIPLKCNTPNTNTSSAHDALASKHYRHLFGYHSKQAKLKRSPPLAFDRCNRYTLLLSIKKKVNVCQSGPGQARMHP